MRTKKKVICFVTSLCLMFGMFYLGIGNTGTRKVVAADATIGDITNNSKIDSVDMTRLQEYLVGSISLTGVGLEAANTTGDAEDAVDVKDLVRFKRYLAEADAEWSANSEGEYHIYDVADFLAFQKASATESFSGKTVYLDNDIVVNVDGAIDAATSTTTGLVKGWEPIGKSGANTDYSAFAGTFDGQGHTISGIYVTVTSGAIGLFGETGNCVLQDFVLSNSYIASTGSTSTQGYVGGIAGISCGTIDSVKVDATVHVKNENHKDEEVTGGILGQMVETTGADTMISNCWFDGKVSGGWGVAGILGEANNCDTATMEHCLNSGTIVDTTNGQGYIGGLCGEVNYSTLSISDSLNIGGLTSTLTGSATRTGSVIGGVRQVKTGSNNTYIAVVKNTYGVNDETSGWKRFAYLSNSGAMTVDETVYAGTSYSGSVDAANKAVSLTNTTCLTTQENMTGTTGYANMDLDFYVSDNYTTGHWLVNEASTPALKIFADEETVAASVDIGDMAVYNTARTTWYNANETEYTLYTPADLYGFAEISKTNDFANKTVKLGADITVNTGNAAEWAEVGPSYSWTPIGSNGTETTDIKAFDGTFDGDNHTISGIYISSYHVRSGLFSEVSGTVREVRLQNSYIHNIRTNNGAAGGTGSIVGLLSGMVDTVYSDAYVVKTTGNYTGGLVGSINTADKANTITNSCFAGKVSGKNFFGGILGGVGNCSATMTHCLNSGEVYVTTSGMSEVGGLCGGVSISTSTYKFTLEDSMNVGTVTNSTFVTSGAIGSIIGLMNCSAGFNSLVAESTYGLSAQYLGVTEPITYWTNFTYLSSDAQISIGGITYSKSLKGTQYVTTNLWTDRELQAGERTVVSGEEAVTTELGLDFEKYWAQNEGYMPVLKSFEDLLIP